MKQTEQKQTKNFIFLFPFIRVNNIYWSIIKFADSYTAVKSFLKKIQLILFILIVYFSALECPLVLVVFVFPQSEMLHLFCWVIVI